MRRLRLAPLPLLAALLLAGGAGAARAGEETQAQPGADSPRIRVDPAGFDFGRALSGQTLRKAFTLRNVGGQDLVLQKPRTSCGCTVAELAVTTLKPGQSTPLSISLQTGGRLGPMTKSVALPSNDPKTPLLELRVQVTVESPPGVKKK